ncbi:hypothetical protein QVD17_03177 [Tagetes erecta]|uniref:G domain-containing protein n=1 Tax=Tagetes erecta TaxID=13708 RepID=A0AAD8P9S9_TARER|nr:hypothetical protein QVD17_03177 [Tagetes erecta]
MGGGTVSIPSSTTDDDNDNLSIITPPFPHHFTQIHNLWPESLNSETMEVNESVIGEIDANETRMRGVYAQVIKSYDDVKDRVGNIEVEKRKVLSYTPGSWVENVGGLTMSDYNVPKTTTLLLVGPEGSGKSSLVNRISQVFEDDKFAPERAQVAYNSSIWSGTRFLQEYMIPRNSTSFCLFDTCGFFNDLDVNLEMIVHWMTEGVCHGELVNISDILTRTNSSTHQDKFLTCERRRVDFVIIVVNGFSVLKCLESNGADTQYIDMVTEVFSSPSLSFKDQKPAIAITHGDLLSLSERAAVRVCLGNRLGVHPIKQTFDIPDNCEPTTELAIVDLVRFALEHADRNFPRKSRLRRRISNARACNNHNDPTILPWTHLLLLLAVGIFMFTAILHRPHFLKLSLKSVPEPNLEVRNVMEFDQESVLKPDPGIKKVTETDPEILPVPSLEIKKEMEFDQESVPKSDLDMKKAVEFDQESVPESDVGLKKVTELYQESVPESDVEIKKVAEFDQEGVPESDVEMKKVVEFDQEGVPEPDVEMKEAVEFDQESASESDLEIEKVTEFDESHLEIKDFTEIDLGIVPEPILEMKKVIPGSISKSSKKAKKVDAEKTPSRNKKLKKSCFPEIDWKTIRHIW